MKQGREKHLVEDNNDGKNVNRRVGGGVKYFIIVLVILIIALPIFFFREKNPNIQYYDNAEISKLVNLYGNYYIYELSYSTMPSYPTDVVFVGDSITHACQWNEIFLDLSVKNRGIPSDTTRGLRARVDSIIKTQPKKVFIMIGINDFVRDIKEEETLDNYRNILDMLLEVPGIEVYVESILPVGQSTGIPQEKIIQVNALIEDMCHEKGIEYIDLYNIFSDDNGYLAEQYSADGVHINAKGYECWINSIGDYVY